MSSRPKPSGRSGETPVSSTGRHPSPHAGCPIFATASPSLKWVPSEPDEPLEINSFAMVGALRWSCTNLTSDNRVFRTYFGTSTHLDINVCELGASVRSQASFLTKDGRFVRTQLSIVRCLVLASTVLALQTSVNDMFAQCRFQHSEERTLTYRFVPEPVAGGLVLHVTVEFQSSAGGSDTLIVPNAWASETLHAITELHAVSPHTTLEQGADAHLRIVRSSPNRPAVITYDLRKDWNGPFVAPLQFHPVITPEYLEFNGNNALVRLQLPDGSK